MKWFSYANSMEISHAVQKVAFANGWKWVYSGQVLQDYSQILGLRTSDKCLINIERTADSYRQLYPDVEIKTLPELLGLLGQPSLPEIDGNQPVVCSDGSLKVGCTVLSFSLVQQIYQAAKTKQGSR